MTDKEIEQFILLEINRRGITWLDMIGGRCISYEEDHERICRDNVFESTSWSDRLAELISEGDYDPSAEFRPSLQDLIRFWWNHCVCQEDIIDEMLEDVFTHFKDVLTPCQDEEPEEPMDWDLDLSEIIVAEQAIA